MTRTPLVLCSLGAATLMLNGCVAAVIPVVAGGAIGNKQLRARHHRARATDTARVIAATPASSAVAPVAPVAPPPPLPTDLSRMEEGKFYTGQMPAPGNAPISPAEAPSRAALPSPARLPSSPTIAAANPDRNGWTAIVHYVASTSLTPPTDSVLLARASTAAAPIWVPCGQKPLAVVVALDAIGGKALTQEASASLDAIETMGLTLVYTGVGDIVAARTQTQALAARVKAPVEGETLFLARPGSEGAQRAAIAARYCAIAVVGTGPADFPNAILPSRPGASPGWFLLPQTIHANGN